MKGLAGWPFSWESFLRVPAKADTALQAEPSPCLQADLGFRGRCGQYSNLGQDQKGSGLWVAPGGAGGPAPARVTPATLDASPANLAAAPKPPWRASGVAGLEGMTPVKNLLPPAVGREVGFEMAAYARRVHTLQKARPPGHGHGGQQSRSRPAGCCLWQRAALLACVAFRVLAVTSRSYSETTLFPAFPIAMLQRCFSLFSVQNIGFVESQYISSIYLPSTTLYFNPVLLGICISSLV